MPARFQWTAGLIRLYASEADADALAPYGKGVLSISRVGQEAAYLHGLHAALTRELRRDIVEELLRIGITSTSDHRRGRLIVRDLKAELLRHTTET